MTSRGDLGITNINKYTFHKFLLRYSRLHESQKFYFLEFVCIILTEKESDEGCSCVIQQQL